MVTENAKQSQVLKRRIAAAAFVALACAGAYGLFFAGAKNKNNLEASSQSHKNTQHFTPTPSEWATLTIEPVKTMAFRAEFDTEGKIAVDEDRSTPVFSPYAGRVTKLLAKPGENVKQGQPLFVIEAADTVQAQNDFIAAVTAQNKAKSALELADIQYKRAKDLYEGKAVPLKDFQQAEANFVQAQNDMRSSQTALEAARNKLQILGFTDAAIAAFQNKGSINPEITIFSPISGTECPRCHMKRQRE